MKNALLLNEASRWIGITEQGGNNRGQLVQLFQKAVDGSASAEPWCMSFVQYCVKMAEAQLAAAGQPVHSKLFRSEHCQTVFQKSAALKCEPKPGAIIVWAHYKAGKNTGQGHTGIVRAVRMDGMLETVEGNTGDGAGVVRDGDGVFKRLRSPKGDGDMRVLGFLDPWA